MAAILALATPASAKKSSRPHRRGAIPTIPFKKLPLNEPYPVPDEIPRKRVGKRVLDANKYYAPWRFVLSAEPPYTITRIA